MLLNLFIGVLPLDRHAVNFVRFELWTNAISRQLTSFVDSRTAQVMERQHCTREYEYSSARYQRWE